MRRIIRDLTQSLILASIVIFAVMTCAFRSLTIGLIAAISNLFPLVATAAIRVWIDGSLDIASACAFTVSLGIAVDDTIHFVTRFQHERRRGADVAQAIHTSVRTVGSALVMTTVVMLAGMSTVLVCQLPSYRWFAAMSCSTIAAALLADLIMLPALMAFLPIRVRPPAANPKQRARR